MENILKKYIHFVETIKPRPTIGELQLLGYFAKYLESGNETDIPGNKLGE
jgi:hypothetical protein